MDFNIDINKLSGEWKQWAENADNEGDKDKHINSVLEVDKVINQALDANKDAKEIAEVFHASISGNAQAANVKGSPDKDTAKAMKKEVFNKLDSCAVDFAETGSWDNVASNLTASMISQTQSIESRIYYSQLASQVKSVIDAVKTHEFKNRDDVEKLYDQVKADLNIDKNDEFKDFKLDILEMLVDMAEVRQKTVESDVLTKRFTELRKKEGQSREQAMEIIKNDPSFKGSYTKSLIKDMNKGVALEDAREQVWDAIEKQVGKGLTKSKDIEKAVVEELKANNAYDKYTKKVLRGELSFGEKLKWDRSNVKAFRKKVAAANRVVDAKAKTYTEAEIRDTLKTKQAFAGLISNEATFTDEHGNTTKGTLITEKLNADGTTSYDISNLSDLIVRRVGADYRANKQKRALQPYNEIENIRAEISAKCGCDITTKDAKRLIKLCGFDVEKKNWAEIITAALIDTALSSMPAAAATGLFLASAFLGKTGHLNREFPTAELYYDNDQEWGIKIHIEGIDAHLDEWGLIEQLDRINVKCTDVVTGETQYLPLSDFLDYDNDLEGSGTLTLNYKRLQSGQINIVSRINEDLTAEDIGINPKEDLALQILKGLAVSFAINLIKAALMHEQGEIPIATTQFNETDLNQYLDKLSKNKKLSPAMFQGIKALAECFVEKSKDGKPVEGGKWDSEHFKRVLNTIAGDESLLNKHEGAIGFYEAAKSKPAPTPAPEPPKPEPEPEPIQYETTTKETKADSYTPKTTEFSAWKDLVNGYDCLNDKKYNVVVKNANGKNVVLNNRMVKILQAMDLSKVDKDAKLQDVYNVDVIAEFAKVAIEKDIDAALEQFPDFPIDKQKYNEVVYASGGVKGSVVIPELYDDDGNEFSWADKGKVKIKLGGKEVVTVTTTSRTVNGETHYYKREKGSNGPWTEISKSEYDKLQ